MKAPIIPSMYPCYRKEGYNCRLRTLPPSPENHFECVVDGDYCYWREKIKETEPKNT